MARPDIEQPTRDERGDEHHPAFGMIGASRVSSGGATLFQSDIQHQHTVMVRIKGASRRRDLNHDYVYAENEIIEIEMSEAQWASFVSTMNVGDGVPCTIRHQGRQWTPELPFQPRMAESMAEVRGAADKAMRTVLKAFENYAEHRTKGNLQSLEHAIRNLPANLTFASRSMEEHAENVVQRARADVEAMMLTKAKQLGIDPGDIGLSLPQLESPVVDASDDEG